MHRTLNHLRIQLRQTATLDTDTPNSITRMHKPRAADIAKVAPHDPAALRGPRPDFQVDSVRRVDGEGREDGGDAEGGARLSSAERAVADVDDGWGGGWCCELVGVVSYMAVVVTVI